jgi:hypothetical protein
MNFLELAQRVRQEAGGVAGADSTPATVVSQTGQLAKIVKWTNDAWRDIQLSKTDWTWKRKQFTLSLSANDNDYTAADAGVTDLGEWDDESMRIYLTSVGVADESYLSRMEYALWRDVWNFGVKTPSRPNVVTVKPDLHLGFGPVPNASYTVAGEYLQATQSMTVDSDEPDGLPEEFHMLIVYGALKKYAIDEAAPELYAAYREDALRLRSALERKCLPRWRTGGPLA